MDLDRMGKNKYGPIEPSWGHLADVGYSVLILCTFILAILSLYWAILFNYPQNLETLKVAVVNFDGQLPPYLGVEPLVGQAFEQAVAETIKSPEHLGLFVRGPSTYNNDPMAVRQAVYDEHIWAAIIINANATALLREAVETGNASYDPMGVAQFIYNEARDETVADIYIVPFINELETQVTSQFGAMWAKQVLTNSTLSRATMARAPQAISPAIGFSTYNLRPFFPYTATPAVTIGLIYLIIIAFFSFSFFLPIHTKYMVPKNHPPLHFYQFIIWRWVATVVAYFFMSLAYSLVSLAFQIPFSNPPAHSDTSVVMNANAFGKGTFPVYWMLNFVGMCALGLACENVAMVIGQPWTALWLIFWVITNVSTSFYAIELSPRFFYWGWAWPLEQIVTCSRTLIFGTHSRLGLNFGILFAWAAVNTALFPLACVFMRWKSEGAKAKEEGKEKPDIRTLLE